MDDVVDKSVPRSQQPDRWMLVRIAHRNITYHLVLPATSLVNLSKVITTLYGDDESIDQISIMDFDVAVVPPDRLKVLTYTVPLPEKPGAEA